MKHTNKLLAASLTMALLMPVSVYAQATDNTPVLTQTNAAPLGLEIGVATIQSAKSHLGSRARLQDAGINRYSGGTMLKAKAEDLGVDGLRDITLIFDKSNVLVGLIMTMDKRPKDTYKTLSIKYSVKENKINTFMDYGYARFSKGNSVIELDAPHMSFDMEVRYLTKGFMSTYTQKTEASAKEAAEKRSNAL